MTYYFNFKKGNRMIYYVKSSLKINNDFTSKVITILLLPYLIHYINKCMECRIFFGENQIANDKCRCSVLESYKDDYKYFKYFINIV